MSTLETRTATPGANGHEPGAAPDSSGSGRIEGTAPVDAQRRAALLDAYDCALTAVAEGDDAALDAFWASEADLAPDAVGRARPNGATGFAAALFPAQLRHVVPPSGPTLSAEAVVTGDSAWVFALEQAPARARREAGDVSRTAGWPDVRLSVNHFITNGPDWEQPDWRLTARFVFSAAPVSAPGPDAAARRAADLPAPLDGQGAAEAARLVASAAQRAATQRAGTGGRDWAAVSWAVAATAGVRAGEGTPALRLHWVEGREAARAGTAGTHRGWTPGAPWVWVTGDIAWVAWRETAGSAAQAPRCVLQQLVRLAEDTGEDDGWRVSAHIVLGEPASPTEPPDTLADATISPVEALTAAASEMAAAEPVAPANPHAAPARAAASQEPAPAVGTAAARAEERHDAPHMPGVRRQRRRGPRALQVAVLERVSGVNRWELAVLGVALLIYAVTRLWRLGEFPLYFFTDEAVQPLAAEQLLRDGFRSPLIGPFPMYFQNGGAWAPLLPVYFHAITVALFGKSVEVTRATSSLFTVTGAFALAVLLKVGFRSRVWWAAPLFLAAVPGWFVHSRTSFETVFMAVFYAWFLLFYVLYRVRSPWFLFPAILAGAGAFYSYSNGQVVMAACAGLLALVDLPYHLRRWRYVLVGLALVGAVAVPLVVFRRAQPNAMEQQLTRVSSYWFAPITTQQKLATFVAQFERGLSPWYWFVPNDKDLTRHRMLGYPQMPVWSLPLFLLGVAACLWRVRSPAHRVVLIAGLAAPAGASLAEVGITRMLCFIMPATLASMVGLDLLVRLARPARVRLAVSVVAFALLAIAPVALLRDALTNGPLWFRDYGMGGQQWGAKQIFDVIGEYRRAEPDTQILLTSTWANGTDLYPRFFMDKKSLDASKVVMGNVRDFLQVRRPLTRNMILIMTPEELKLAQSGRFADVSIERTLTYPDGTPGFYFVRMSYSPDFDRIAAAEKEARRALVDDQATIDGQAVRVRHSLMDGGSLKDIFDGETRTMGRFNAANPAVMELYFPQARTIQTVVVTLSAGNWDVVFRAVAPGDEASLQSAPAIEHIERSPTRDPQFEVPLSGAPGTVSALRIEMKNMDAGEDTIVHLREIQLR